MFFFCCCCFSCCCCWFVLVIIIICIDKGILCWRRVVVVVATPAGLCNKVNKSAMETQPPSNERTNRRTGPNMVARPGSLGDCIRLSGSRTTATLSQLRAANYWKASKTCTARRKSSLRPWWNDQRSARGQWRTSEDVCLRTTFLQERAALEIWAELGCSVKLGIELEGYLLQPNPTAKAAGRSTETILVPRSTEPVRSVTHRAL